MKKILSLSFAVFASVLVFGQSSLEVSRDQYGNKVLKGFIAQNQLATDTAFTWYAQNQKSFAPDANVVKQYSASKDSVNFVVFGGTWCDDTKLLLPKFYATANAAGIPASRITLIGVDRDKKSLFNLTDAFGIINVPTIIVMKNGKEVGRVVEFGRMGAPEKEVAEIIADGKKK